MARLPADAQQCSRMTGRVLAVAGCFWSNPSTLAAMREMTNLAELGANFDSRRTPNLPGQRLLCELLALVCAAWLGQSETSAQATQRQALRGHVPPVVAHLHALERLPGTN